MMLEELMVLWQLHVVWSLPIYHIKVEHYHFAKAFQLVLDWLKVFLRLLSLNGGGDFLENLGSRLL